MRRIVASLVVAVALLVPMTGAASAATTSYAGLWSPTFVAGETAGQCGSFPLDSNSFCYASGGSVALGVKFTTVSPVLITGVRIYRVDGSAITGALWNADSSATPLASGTFDAYSGTHGWQDLVFSSPVWIVPGQTYVASYYVPGGSYAFQYNYFTSNSYTVGPITALQSVGGNGNGVYCFSSTPCFPTGTYMDLNYWVTPLWVSQYAESGFFAPVSMTSTNVVKAGSAVPVKFSLGGDQGLSVIAPGYPQFVPGTCPSASTTDVTVTTAGSSSLSYDPTSDQYTYVWKTDKSLAGACGTLTVAFADGSSLSATFQFK